MLLDFTLKSYRNFLNALQEQGFFFLTFIDFLNYKNTIVQEGCTSYCKVLNNYELPLIILRHDVEKKYLRALDMAVLEAEMRINSTYYFRLSENHVNASVIQKIVNMGHEIGYHYDDLSACKGNYELAIRRFVNNLNYLRTFGPVKTIAMEGAPRSRYDNRLLWSKYNYRDYGIIGEPYFDLNFDEFFYLTDTGRRWDGWKFSVRDKIPLQEKWFKKGLVFRSTKDVITAAEKGLLPNKIMITTHPQRWSVQPLEWLNELVSQTIKNQIKRVLINIGFYK